MPVLIYNGQDDIICNTPSTENWINELEWPDDADFYNFNRLPWMENNQTVGMYKGSDNFWFVVVNKAGHLVPMD